MNTKELVALLGDKTGQVALFDKAKAGDCQAMLDFARLSLLKHILENPNLESREKGIAVYEELMAYVKLTAEDFKPKNG